MLFSCFEKIFNKKVILQVVNPEAEVIKLFKILTKDKLKWGWNSFFINFFLNK